jgi:hypothetical protein
MRRKTGTCSSLLAFAFISSLAVLACKDTVTSGGPRGGVGAGRDDPSLALSAAAIEVCGVIPATLVITENTRLTCDVACLNTTGPCIQFGRDNVTLFLNGFTMSGPAMPPNNCAPSPALGANGDPGPFPFDGISTAGFDHVRIRGPGMVQTFRRHGVFVYNTSDAIVENVTSHYNCYSGIFLGLSNDNLLSENVSVRNGSASGAAPCGGNCITNSNDNLVRRNHFFGSGSIVSGAPLGTPNDFGVGLVGTSSGNVIEENDIGGNINGILLFPLTARNVIRRNVIAGNPPVQVSATAGSPIGVDVRDASPPGANTFTDNHCITYEGATVPAPCPNFPATRGN